MKNRFAQQGKRKLIVPNMQRGKEDDR